MQNKRIHHVTVIGSGLMGAGIACHLAGAGFPVLLLDLLPKDTPDDAPKAVRNKIAAENLKKSLKSNPSPIFSQKFAERIQVGNLADDLAKIKDSDWVIEVIVENLEIKKSLFEKVEQHRKPGSFITSNTSGIPIHLMSEGRSDDFQSNFCGTHFFNPPRYLRLFEIIPGPKTNPEVIEFFTQFCDKFLGKQPILCKDTPGFIGNRVGVYSMAKVMELAQDEGLTIEEADTLTGSILGRPKTGTFKLADLVGLDTAAKVTKGLQLGCPNDQMVNALKDSKPINFLLENGFLGDKSQKGFYYKERDKEGKTLRFALDLDKLEYRPLDRQKMTILETAKQAGGTGARLAVTLKDDSKYGKFLRKHLASLFAYVSHRIPEISDHLFSIDDALKTGYAWKYGPFETWGLLGIKKGLELIESEGFTVADWVKEVPEEGFYKVEDGYTLYYDIPSKSYQRVPGQEQMIILDNIRKSKEVWSNAESVIEDLGDGIINLEFRSKMNSMGGGVLQGINKAINLAEEKYNGLVIANQGDNFSVGANLAMILMMASEQDWFELNRAVKYFQDTVMRARYSSIPVVVAPHGMTFGGGCELSMHADCVVASAETYIGLVEFGVGLIPAGGGTKEFMKRAADKWIKDDTRVNDLREAYLNIAMARVAKSAHEAFELGVFQQHKDVVVMNKSRQVAEAKRHALFLSEGGYTQPLPTKVTVLGNKSLGMFLVGSDQMQAGHYISEHDQLMADKLGYVMTGGKLSEPTEVSEQYLLDLEREAFLSLCGERKTLERIQSMLKTGKPLRN